MNFVLPLLQLTFSTVNQPSYEPVLVDNVLVTVFRITYTLLAFMLNIFAFVVIRQVSVMNDTVSTPLGPVLRIGSIVFFAFTVFLSVLAVTQL